MPKPSVDYLAILKTLRRHGVDFIIVGGVCAVLHGAPVATFDLDVVHSREPHNLARLMAALEELDARTKNLPFGLTHSRTRNLLGTSLP